MNEYFKEIDSLRTKLNNLILNNADYGEIYQTSIELDEVISKFYKVRNV